MKARNNLNHYLVLAIVALLTLSLTATTGWAQKGKGQGKGGGGETGANGGGKIYFRVSVNNQPQYVYSMNDDGSAITMFSDADWEAGYGHPSFLLHGGKRWFAKDITQGMISVYSDSGHTAHLTFPADFELLGSVRWAYEDEYISFVGRKWDVDPVSDSFGQVIEGGLYSIGYSEDVAGTLVYSEQVPDLLFSSELVFDLEGDLRPDMDRHSLAPDGIQFVYSRYATKQLDVGEFLTGSSQFLYVDPDGLGVNNPKWSPQDNRIAFQSGYGRGKLMVVNSDGTGAFTLAQGGSNWTPTSLQWSPTASHIVYTHSHNLYRDTYLVRVQADGSNPTRITNRKFYSGDRMYANGWRAVD